MRYAACSEWRVLLVCHSVVVSCCVVMCRPRKSLEPRPAASAMASLLDTVGQVEAQSHPLVRPLARASSSRCSGTGPHVPEGRWRRRRRPCARNRHLLKARAQAVARTTRARTPRGKDARRRGNGMGDKGRGDGDEGCGRGDLDGWSPSPDSSSSSPHVLCRCMCGDTTVAADDIDLDGPQEPMPSWRMLRCERCGCGPGGGSRIVWWWRMP